MELAREVLAVLEEALLLVEILQVSVGSVEDLAIQVEDQVETQVVGLVAVQKADQQVVPVEIPVEDSGNQVEVVDTQEEVSVAGEVEEVTLVEVQEWLVPCEAVVGMEAKEALEMGSIAGRPGICFRMQSLLIFKQREK